MNVILLGPPGAGKGTLAANIKGQLNLEHLSSGDILREEMKKGTELGKKAQQYISQGRLVPDEDIIDMILAKLDSLENGVLLDGFPRTVVQAEKLSERVKIDAALELVAGLDEIMERICTRLVCKDCGSVYNVKTHPSEICDKCGGTLITRDDDKPETVTKRYTVYLEQTQPLIDFYKERGILYSVNAIGNVDEIAANALDILNTIE